MVTDYPTAEDLRLALEFRVRQFRRLSGMSYSEVGLRAVNDTSAIPRLIKDDSDFKVSTYEALMTWLDSNWPGRKPKREASPAPAT